MKRGTKRILVDAREFTPGRLTGIGRVLTGLVDALAASDDSIELVLALQDNRLLPTNLNARENIRAQIVPPSFWRSEIRLSQLTSRAFSIFISPYPKLPFFGCACASIHIIHDVLDLTHPAYKKRLKAHFDRYRLKRALRLSDLTWYDSEWSFGETQRLVGASGKNPRVRYPAIDASFRPLKSEMDASVLMKYGLEPGYVLIIGNGLPHKNPGVLLEIADYLPRRIVLVGALEQNQQYWNLKFPNKRAMWICHVEEDDLPSVIRGAFCLAQPSMAEGYGYPPLEAMACGIPTIVSHIPILYETTGSVALYSDPHDPRSWQKALSSLENSELYRIQVEKGLKWVTPLMGRKAWAKYVSDICELLGASTNDGWR
jgi:glycosyltransferase involved in cell wall biosynthesis